jgi:chromosome segregation ATPase
MQAIQAARFHTIISALENSADSLRNQNKEDAQKNILVISEQIQFLEKASQNKESEYQETQQQVTQELVEIIKREGELRERSLDIQNDINALNIEIKKQEADGRAIADQINTLQEQLRGAEAELREHQARLDELNDKSAGSIVRSVFLLGLDRAIMGINSLIENDTGHIRSLNDELSRYRSLVENDANAIRDTERILYQLDEKKRSSEALIDEFSRRAIELHEHEKACRQRLVFLTKVALFYGKLSIMAQQVEQRVDDVADIVNELNSSEPTITDFDGSEYDLISLRQALEKFDEILDGELI